MAFQDSDYTGNGVDYEDQDNVQLDISLDPAVMRDLGVGDDTVDISADATVPQVRLTFTSSEVGNDLAQDSNTLANQDGGLAVRVQAENGTGDLTGPVSRFDDEGITFESNGAFTFDVRDLVSGTQRGALFDTVVLGTIGNDLVDESGSSENYYINAGMGDDSVDGGVGNDFLVGGAGDDTLRGCHGDDSLLGGAGDDRLSGGLNDDVAIFNVSTDGSDKVRLGAGLDTVNVSAAVGTTQVRLTFTSSEVGNCSAKDSDTLTGQDGGLAVRMQAEDGSDMLVGSVSRYDDEGIRFVSTTPGMTFDVRDLVSGAQRGDLFEVVQLGTHNNNRFNERGEAEAYYINAGMGDDRLTGGLANDFLVGGLGNDRLNGREGANSLLGGTGNDVFVFSKPTGDDWILDFVSGTDKIDLTAFGITFADLQTSADGADTVIDVDSDGDTAFDFQIRLLNVVAPVETDYLF